MTLIHFDKEGKQAVYPVAEYGFDERWPGI